MIEFDVVIIGGGPDSVTTAISARNSYPDKKSLLLEKRRR